MDTLRRLFNHAFRLLTCRCLTEKGQVLIRTNSGRLLGSFKPTADFRRQPIIMVLDSPEFKALFTPELKVLSNVFAKYNYEIRIAGGAVRDLLLGKQPKDLDFATVATPDQMREMFTKEEIRMINAKGESHGTVTPRINDAANFEVTTLRIDIGTDGRHAKVQFTQDWLLDANRRDLTINSMFLGLDGTVYDYFNGFEDLKNRRVVFVGNAEDRIKEDYLRILRYFRFFGRIATDPYNYDDATIKVIKANVVGLDQIAGERIWSEVRLILSGNHGPQIFSKMISVGIAPHIGLPVNPNVEELKFLIERTQDINLHPVSYLASTLNNMAEAISLNNRLKMSTFERELVYFIINNREEKLSVNPLLPFQKLMLHSKFKVSDVQEWCVEVLLYNGHKKLAEEMKEWEMPRRPVTGNDLKAHVTHLKYMGEVLKRLNDYWAENDFKSSSEELMSLLPGILEEVQAEDKSKEREQVKPENKIRKRKQVQPEEESKKKKL